MGDLDDFRKKYRDYLKAGGRTRTPHGWGQHPGISQRYITVDHLERMAAFREAVVEFFDSDEFRGGDDDD